MNTKHEAPMHIVVCVKAVPRGFPKVAVSSAGDRVVPDTRFFTTNEPDEYALEEAAALKKATGATLTAVTVGPLPTLDILYNALAKGADTAVRIDTEPLDSARTARLLACLLPTLQPDLVLTGMESRDNLSSLVGVTVAALMDLPFATAVTAIQPEQGALRVTKELGGGAKEELLVPLPAVLAVQVGARPISFLPMPRLMQARQKPVRSVTPKDLGMGQAVAGASRVRVLELVPPQPPKGAKLLQGDARQIARTLLDRIAEAR